MSNSERPYQILELRIRGREVEGSRQSLPGTLDSLITAFLSYQRAMDRSRALAPYSGFILTIEVAEVLDPEWNIVSDERRTIDFSDTDGLLYITVPR